jgi:hypothetical protein
MNTPIRWKYVERLPVENESTPWVMTQRVPHIMHRTKTEEFTVETKWIILIYLFFKFNWIFYYKQPHFTIYLSKQHAIVFISDDQNWPSMIASQYISFRVGQRMLNDELTQ